MSLVVAETIARPAPARFSTTETLRDGRTVLIRAFRPGDRAGLMIAVGRRSSDRSLRSRFFTIRRQFSDKEIDAFMNVDFVRQVALVALIDEASGPTIIGAGRYIVDAAGSAEIALAVIDDYQGQGIGRALVRHLIAIARYAGLGALTAHVLSENAAMLRVFRTCGLPLDVQHDRDVMHLTLALGSGARI
jgi:GNAT superfamily N-acetyltransferase